MEYFWSGLFGWCENVGKCKKMRSIHGPTLKIFVKLLYSGIGVFPVLLNK